MDSMADVDPLAVGDESSILPELTFDDLLRGDEPLTKKSDVKSNQIRRPPIQTETIMTKSVIPPTIAASINSGNKPGLVKLIHSKVGSGGTIVNNHGKPIATTTPQGRFIKLAPTKPNMSTNANAVTLPGPAKKTMPPNTTAVKTSSGQIIYLQRKIGSPAGVPVRMASNVSLPSITKSSTVKEFSSVAPQTVTSAGQQSGVNAITGNSSAAKQTVAIHVIRRADGNLIPVRGKNVSLTAASQQIARKDNLGSNQVILKSPTNVSNALTAISPTSINQSVPSTTTISTATGNDSGPTKPKIQKPNPAPTANSSTIAVPRTTGTTSVLGGAASTAAKIIVQTANGKQQLLSTQNIIKLSPTCSTANSSGQIQAIQIPGKSGVQYVRVYNSPGSITQKVYTANSTNTGTVVTTTAAAAPNNKLLNVGSMVPPGIAQQKVNLIRAGTGGTMKMLIKSPQKESGKQMSPLASKVQKTIVTMPTLKKIDISTTSTAGVTNSNPTSSQLHQVVKRDNNVSGVASSGLALKPRISEINSEIQRFSSNVGGGVSKADVSGATMKKKIVVLSSQSMLRKNFTGFNKNAAVLNSTSTPPVAQQRPTFVQANSAETSKKKMLSVLKKNAEQPSNVAATIDETKMDVDDKKSINLFVEKNLQKIKSEQFPQEHQKISSNNNSQQKMMIPKQESKKDIETPTAVPEIDDNSTLRRKHCNCTKSQCLKLYCDCFANGEFCQDCNCKDCFNNLQYEDERQKAIRTCLERNPSAFKPKITASRNQSDLRSHNKGCNCKRSGCLKNYCECYEAKIPCSSLCKCFGCRNIEDRPDLDMDPMDNARNYPRNSNAGGNISSIAGVKRSYEKYDENLNSTEGGGGVGGMGVGLANNSAAAAAAAAQSNDKTSCNFITQDVIDATIQCMIAQADECEKNGLPVHQTEKMVMEELGRCLVEIIDFSIRNTDTN